LAQDSNDIRPTEAFGASALQLQWQDLFQAIGQVSFILDPHLRLLAVNAATCQRLGQEASALLGRHCYELIHNSDQPPSGCPAQELLANGGCGPITREMPALGGLFMVCCAPVRDADDRISQIIHIATDITVQRQRETRLQSLLKAVPVGIGVAVQRVIVSVNDYLCQMLGYRQEELLGQAARLLYPSEADYEYVGQEKFRQMASGGVGRVETRWRRRDGTLIDVLLSSAPVVPGDLTGEIVFTALDITATKQALAALQVSEDTLTSIFNSVHNGLCILDTELNIIRVNPPHERYFAAHAHLVGKKCYQVFHERSHPCTECPSQETIRTGRPAQKIMPVAGPDGQPRRWVALHTSPWLDPRTGALQGVIEHIIDITAQRRVEEKLTDLILNAPIGIYILQEGRFRLINPATVTAITGYSQEELLGKEALTLVAPEYREEVRRQARQRLKSNSHQPYEYEILTKSGQRRWILESVASAFYDGRRATLGYFVDITASKHLELQLQQAQKMEAIGLLAGGIAHDFNNLLAILSGYSDLLLLDQPPAPVLTQYAQEMKKAVDRGAALVRQLLAFGRRQIIQPEVLNANDILTDLQPMLTRLLGAQIQLILRLAPDLQTVKVDRSQFEQIIMNLAVNARDAMPQGGHLILETANVCLDQGHVAAAGDISPGPYILVAVSDTGVGMDADTRARIFEPFFTTKELGRGTGLGLATVYGIVKQNRGHIEVVSEPGCGSTFRIYLPPYTAPLSLPAGSPPSLQPLRGQETILVVEDDEALRSVIVKALTAHGYQVLHASQPDEALGLARRHPGPIQVLLTDVVLPQMDGSELAARLVLHHPELRVLFMSGYTADAIVHHGVLDETVNFLPKPFRIPTLMEKIRQLLDQD